MASINLYKKLDLTTRKNTGGGYKNVVYWAPRNTFLSIKTPLAVPVLLGDKKKITTTHTFLTDEGFITWLCKMHSVTLTAETVGDAGAQSLVWSTKFVLLGDDALTMEEVEDQLNADNIWLLKDQDCLNATDFVQLGDECLSPEVKVSMDGKTTAEGLKEYTVELKVKEKKFFYSGTVTQKP